MDAGMYLKINEDMMDTLKRLRDSIIVDETHGRASNYTQDVPKANGILYQKTPASQMTSKLITTIPTNLEQRTGGDLKSPTESLISAKR